MTDRDGRIIALWNAGKISGQIAATIGGTCTRNSIIGVICQARKRGEQIRSINDRPRAAPYKRRQQRASTIRGCLASIEMRAGGCQYIHGDPRKPGWSWCNEPVMAAGRPYCAEHHALCYSKTTTAAVYERAMAGDPRARAA